MILLGLGSNVGDREDYLKRAIQTLEARCIEVTQVSSVMEVPALLPPGAPKEWDQPFLNQVIQVLTHHSPASLLSIGRSIEERLGRRDRGRWGPREIDIDLLTYEDRVITMEALIVPHPRMHERRFVLEPMLEIAPYWRHPWLHKTTVEMLKDLE